MNKDFGKRIKSFRQSLGEKVTQKDFAIIIGGKINQTNITSWEAGHIPDGPNLELIYKAFPLLNKEWLLTGSGEMLLKPESNKHVTVTNSWVDEKIAYMQKIIDTQETLIKQLQKK